MQNNGEFKMTNIRPYRESDKFNVQRVCLQTVNDEVQFEGLNRNNADFFLTVYCNYYIEQEPQNCFVTVNENDEAVGYIICAENVRAYIKTFMNEYFPKLEKKRKFMVFGEVLVYHIFASRYPAHLHIDILKEYRGGGTGTQMLKTLTDHLKNKNIKGVQLCVSAENTRAIKFYERFGFKKLMNFGKGFAMGYKIK